MAYDDIELSVDGPVARLIINRPDKLNAMRNQTADEMCDAIHALDADATVRVLVITGAGRGFGAGFDLSMVDLIGDAALERVLEDHFNPLIRAIRGSRLAVISAVNGPCAGVSAGVALACDIVLAARDAYFLEPFAEIALVPDGGNSFFLASIAGRARAMAAMILGDRIPAEQALEWGLVWRVVDGDALLALAQETALRVAARAPLTVQRTKQLVSAATEAGLSAQLDLERDYQSELGARPEMVEAVGRFVRRG